MKCQNREQVRESFPTLPGSSEGTVFAVSVEPAVFREEFVLFYMEAPTLQAPQVQRAAGTGTAPQAFLSAARGGPEWLRNQPGCTCTTAPAGGGGGGGEGGPFGCSRSQGSSWVSLPAQGVHKKSGNQSAEVDLGRHPVQLSPPSHLWLESPLKCPSQGVHQPLLQGGWWLKLLDSPSICEQLKASEHPFS